MEIAILGGGVAGISSAIALKQKGFDVTVYERWDSPSNIGAGIVVWPNAAYVLEQLGILNEIAAVSGYPTKMQRTSNNGENLGAIDINAINQHMGYPSLSILRSDFQNILISKLASLGVSVQYAHAVTNIEDKYPGKAEVHFQNGEKISADIIIGADGRMNSCARSYVHGNNTPHYQGFINWIGVYNTKPIAFEEIAVTDYWGIGERFGIVPITKHKAYWAGGIACAEIGSKNPAEYKTELLTTFADWPSPIQDIIHHTPVERINKIYVHDHDPIAVWHKNNVIIIGDAAHAPLPTSGQGACQALEDAWHLANCLNKNPNNLQKAFSTFTQIRAEKTTNIIMAARGLAASLFNRDEAACISRNRNSKKADYANMAVSMSQFWGQNLSLTA